MRQNQGTRGHQYSLVYQDSEAMSQLDPPWTFGGYKTKRTILGDRMQGESTIKKAQRS